jgi:hypothetical protein
MDGHGAHGHLGPETRAIIEALHEVTTKLDQILKVLEKGT